jgi:hypothetical protein
MSTHQHSFASTTAVQATASTVSVGVRILSVVVGRGKRTYAMGSTR